VRTTVNIVVKQQQKLPENSAMRRDVASQRVSSQSASNSEHTGSKTVCDNLMKPAKNSIKPASKNTVTGGFYSAYSPLTTVDFG